MLITCAKRDVVLVDYNSRGKDECRSQVTCPEIKEKEARQRTKPDGVGWAEM